MSCCLGNLPGIETGAHGNAVAEGLREQIRERQEQPEQKRPKYQQTESGGCLHGV